MARYISDQNKVVLLHESGTYAVVSGNGQWIGQVTSHSISDSEGLIETRYMGTSTRNFDTFEQGPRDVTGTITYSPSDMMLPFFAIGSLYSSGTGTVTHIVSEIDHDVEQSPWTSGTLNAPVSFTLEDSKQAPGTGRNFIRTINGVVPNTMTISASQGDKVNVSLDYIGQTLTHSSGTTTSVTEGTARPYLWSDCLITLGGSPISTITDFSFEINNNLQGPHYVNGSRDISVPFRLNRDYTVSLTVDLDGQDADMLYNNYYKNANTFNLSFDMDADSSTGSQHTVFAMSGCYITAMDPPSEADGATSTSITVRPESVTGSAWDTKTYNPF